jgi:hypothetical protein
MCGLRHRFQLFQLQGRSDAEHPLVAIETAIRDKDVGVRIESKEVTECLHGTAAPGMGFLSGSASWKNIFRDSQAYRLESARSFRS